jgi:hypothetical protein
MDTIWIYLPLGIAAVGALFFLVGLGNLVRLKWVRAGAGMGFGGAAAIAGLLVGLFALNMQTYARLSFEMPVAQITVKAVDPAKKIYQVAVDRLDSTKQHDICTIQGDEWELGGRVQKWKPWANILGLNATYTVEQMTNRYIDPKEGNGKLITACDLHGTPPHVDQYLPKGMVEWMFAHTLAAHRQFGSANFMPMADGAIYRVVITQSGFNTDAVNDIAKKANEKRGAATNILDF